MADVYQSFLRAPNASLLASDAALHYVTTTTSIAQPEAIVKHLETQARQISKKEEKILSTMEGNNGVVLETETTYVFQTSGGVFLPSMDINLLANQSAVIPIVHIVSLDAAGKISQIRLHWDQATLLKQIDAIGKTGRNWPIHDGKAQSKIITDSVNASYQTQPSGDSNTNGNAGQKSKSNATEDFHKRLFSTGGDEDERPSARSLGGPPRESAKPQPRQWGDIFAGETGGDDASGIGSPGIRSPYQPILKAGAGKHYKPNRLFDESVDDDATPAPARKAGAGKNFKPNRLFDETVDDSRPRSPERKKIDPNKYEHFELGASEEVKPLPTQGKKVNNWDFDDFSTPAKHVPKFNPGQERHFGYGIDEDMQPAPPKRDLKHAPRPDAKTHFQIADDFGSEEASKKGPLRTTTNINAARRQEDHAPHYSIKDVPSPANENRAPEKPKSNTNAPLKPRTDMTSNWSFSDMEAEAGPVKKIYKTAGDGMGGRANTRFWDVAGDDAPAQYGGKGGEKQVYKTAGNGMGGKKGTGLQWSIGDPDAA